MTMYTSYMAHPLFRSEAAARLLALLSSMPGRELHTNEIVRRTGAHSRSVQRALVQLETAGILSSRRVGNLRMWRIERDHPLYASLRELFARTRGIPAELEAVLRKDRRVELAFIFGSYVTAQDDPTSDIDLFVVGDPDWRHLSAAIGDAGRRLGREVRPVVWTRNDLTRPSPGQAAFLANVLQAPKIWLIGKEDELERPATRVGAAMARRRRAAAAHPRRSAAAARARRAERPTGEKHARGGRSRRRSDLR